MPGTPPTSPNFGAPRYSSLDIADFPADVNAVTDAFDGQAAKRGAIADADVAPLAAIAKSKLAPLVIVDADVSATAAIAKAKLASLHITDADVDAAAAIAESKLALATDAATGTGSRRTLGTGAQQAAAGNDSRFLGMAPVGTIVPYVGYGDPPEANWVIADGRLIDRTTYADFYGRSGHVYNVGVDPGSNKVKIPDKRGRASIGAINMGSTAGAGANDNAHHQAVRGSSYGEVNHTISAAEMPVHAHGVSDPTHAHSVADPTHGHSLAVNAVSLSGGSQGNVAVNLGSAYNVPYSSGAGFGMSGGVNGAYTGIGIYGAYTGIAVQNAGSGGAHNNIDPTQADSYIVRIA